MPSLPPTAPDPAVIRELLAHADWVRTLARELVRDSHSAEDLAQDTLVAAVESPPVVLSNPRAWLGTVLRNLNRTRYRSISRRTSRELDAARPEALPATDTLVERASLQRDLATHVLELDERYRQILLLRFFEGHSTRKIAQLLDMPQTTVRTRVTRGLDLLRQRLDTKYGNQQHWSLVLAPLCLPAVRPTPAAPLGGLISSPALLIGALLTAIAVALSTIVWNGSKPHLTTSSPPPASVLTGLTSPSANPSEGEPSESEPSARASVAPSKSAPTQALGALSGLLVDERGRALPGVALQLTDSNIESSRRFITSSLDNAKHLERYTPEQQERLVAFAADPLAGVRALGFSGIRGAWVEHFAANGNERPAAETGVDGRWQFEMPQLYLDQLLTRGARIPVAPAGDDWVLLGGGRQSGDPARPVLVAAPRVVMEGSVYDPAGQPLAGVRIEAGNGLRLLHSFSLELEDTWDGGLLFDKTDDLGHFEIRMLPAFAGNELQLSLEGYARLTVAVPTSSLLDLHLLLEPRPAAPKPLLAGTVLTESGQPVAGALVTLVFEEAKTGPNGAFAFETRSSYPDNTQLVAGMAGYQGAIIPWSSIDASEPVTIRLGPAPLSIEGRLTTDKGSAPGPGWRAALADAVPLGRTGQTLEQYSAKNESAVGRYGTVAVDAAGHFHLDGLLDRTYTVLFWNPEGGQAFKSLPLRAGASDVQVRAPEDPIPLILSGKVVDTLGRPANGAVLTLTLSLGRQGASFSTVTLAETHTQPDGSFTLESFAPELSGLAVRGPTILGESWSHLTQFDLTHPLTLQVSGRYSFVLKLVEADPANRFEVHAASGARLPIISIRPNGSLISPEADRGSAGFPVTVVSDLARTLVLFAGDVELRRLRLDPKPGPTQTLEL